MGNKVRWSVCKKDRLRIGKKVVKARVWVRNVAKACAPLIDKETGKKIDNLKECIALYCSEGVEGVKNYYNMTWEIFKRDVENYEKEEKT